MKHYLYILECSDESFYTGITWNLDDRLSAHNAGLSKSTKPRLPVRMVYYEEFEDKFAAAKREKEIKGWSRKKKQKLIDR
jgi:predicted GIY-YIG superfamily endonuclease